MKLLETLTRKLAKRTTADGKPVLQTDGDPDLIAAFAELGWGDPYVEPDPTAEPVPEPPLIKSSTYTGSHTHDTHKKK